MQTRLATGDRIILVAPVVIVIGEFVQRGGIRCGCFAFGGNGRRGFCNQSFVRDIGISRWSRSSQNNFGKEKKSGNDRYRLHGSIITTRLERESANGARAMF